MSCGVYCTYKPFCSYRNMLKYAKETVSISLASSLNIYQISMSLDHIGLEYLIVKNNHYLSF